MPKSSKYFNQLLKSMLFSGNCSIIGIPGLKSSIHWNAKNETILNIRKHLENHPILTETKDSPHSHLTLRAASDILASAKEALDWAKKCVEEVTLRAQSFTSLKRDLCQDIKRVSSFSRYLNGTFP